jgi:hypothetical protein
MTPREALYHLCLELGPIAKTNRDDNLSYKEVQLRDSVRVLQELIHRDEQRDPRQTEESAG